MSELRKQTKEDLVYYVSPQLSVYPRLRHGFFTRTGGVSAAPYDSLNFRFNSRTTYVFTVQWGTQLVNE